MTTNPTTPKRWRPRFSLRTLVILLTLVCCYAACWGPTKRSGVPQVKIRAGQATTGIDASTIAPLFVRLDWEWHHTGDDQAKTTSIYVSEYYFWFFGYVAKLPYERQIAP